MVVAMERWMVAVFVGRCMWRQNTFALSHLGVRMSNACLDALAFRVQCCDDSCYPVSKMPSFISDNTFLSTFPPPPRFNPSKCILCIYYIYIYR